MDAFVDTHEGPVGRFKVIDHLAFGRLIARWALDPDSCPQTIDELKDALEPNIALVPTRYTRMQTVQAESDEFILRLPPKEMIGDTIDVLSGPHADPKATYAVPPFYFLKLRGADGSAPLVSNELLNNNDFFLSRVADYTTAVCR